MNKIIALLSVSILMSFYSTSSLADKNYAKFCVKNTALVENIALFSSWRHKGKTERRHSVFYPVGATHCIKIPRKATEVVYSVRQLTLARAGAAFFKPHKTNYTKAWSSSKGINKCSSYPIDHNKSQRPKNRDRAFVFLVRYLKGTCSITTMRALGK